MSGNKLQFIIVCNHAVKLNQVKNLWSSNYRNYTVDGSKIIGDGEFKERKGNQQADDRRCTPRLEDCAVHQQHHYHPIPYKARSLPDCHSPRFWFSHHIGLWLASRGEWVHVRGWSRERVEVPRSRKITGGNSKDGTVVRWSRLVRLIRSATTAKPAVHGEGEYSQFSRSISDDRNKGNYRVFDQPFPKKLQKSHFNLN